MATKRQTVTIEGRRLQLSSLDKVLYPATGTTKRDVIDYFRRIAPVLLPHCQNRPVTRKRWPDGIGENGNGQVFFQKDIGKGAPDWVELRRIQHKDHVNAYPIANDVATLAWFGQLAALELHVPQWRFGDGDEQLPPDRLVLDLDPGSGTGLRECVDVAKLARALLRDMGLDPVPVTSGSKGIHLYAALDGSQSSDDVSKVAHELARSLEADHPNDIISTIKRSERDGKVFIDWSQNNASKTTVAPYSLRGREHPFVAAPRTWRELASPHLKQLDLDAVLARVDARGDPMGALAPGAADRSGDGNSTGSGDGCGGDSAKGDRASGAAGRDRLTIYRSKRDAARTTEPVPASSAPALDQSQQGDEATDAGAATAPKFVIHRHDASNLHYDFRLEHDGVLVSWALPKGVPTDPKRNRLAVPTEDHPLEYGSFEGTIPKGEYGAGTVEIWDDGTFEIEKWRDDEVIATLTGRPDGGLGGTRTFALFRTRGGEKPQWMIHLMKREAASRGTAKAGAKKGGEAKRGSAKGGSSTKKARTKRGDAGGSDGSAPGAYSPMLAARGDPRDAQHLDENEWAFEMKWDGMRAIVTIDGDDVALHSRNGNNVTDSYPELHDIASLVDATSCVLDGELVAFDRSGVPSFSRLQRRMHVAKSREIDRLRREVAVSLVLFDVLEVNGTAATDLSYRERRELLEGMVHERKGVLLVPPAFDGDARAATTSSREFGLEGIMAKRVTSTYYPGERSDDWRKLPHVDAAEVVVIGWRTSSAQPEGFASLLLAVPTDDGLRYAGRVGTGFSEVERREIRAKLERLGRKTAPADDVPASDARDANWVTPKLVAEVRYRERTDDGRLRHASWRGWRPDKGPNEVEADRGGTA